MSHRADASALLDTRGYRGPLLRGQNPATLIETGVRDRITDSYYWKEQCFGLNEATLCDRAAEVAYIGGTYGDFGKPTPFLCLLFKMLQLQPPKDVIMEYLNWKDEEDEDAKGENGDSNPTANGDSNRLGSRNDFKYLRALAAFYIRLAWDPVDIFKTLEPLLEDYRKLKRRLKDGFVLTYMDQFIDDLLSKDRVCGTALWKLPSRTLLEDDGKLEPRESKVADQLSDSDVDMRDDEEPARRSPSRTSSPPTPRGRSPSTSPERVVKRKRSPSPSRALPIAKRPSPDRPTQAETIHPLGTASGPLPTANDEATKSARPVGPTKSASNVRMTTFIDFAPDVCKDYKQTGFCGFGDSCKFLHAREDYKSGWALDKEWEVERTKKKKDVKPEEKDGGKEEEIPFACFICKKSYTHPVVTKCGHYFCEKCALDRFKKTPACAACGAATGGVFKTAKNLMKKKDKAAS